MRYFELLGFQDIMLYLFPSFMFIVLFGVLLAFGHLRSPGDDERKTAVVERFADDIQGRNAPFPLGMTLILAGTVIWGILYIWFTGALGVKI